MAVAALLCACIGAAPAAAAPFTSGDVVVYRAGDGTGSLVNTGNPVFLDEFTPAGALVQSLPFPTTANGANRALFASGPATSEGLITRSVNGRAILATGYSASGPALPNTNAATVPRVVAVVDGLGAIDTQTALTDFADLGNPRSAASANGTDLFFGGSAGGVRYAPLHATTSTNLALTSARATAIYGGQLFASTSTSIAAIGTGLPTTTTTATALPGIGGSPYAFVMFDLDPSVGYGNGLDTVYVADDTSTTGLVKYSYNGTTFVPTGNISATNVRGVTATVSGGTVNLFVTTGTATSNGGGALYSVTDASGPGGTLTGSLSTPIATSGTNRVFRGVAQAPLSPTAVTWRGASARVRGRGVVVSWTSAAGSDELGYQVYRARLGHRRVRVTKELVPGPAQTTRRAYRVRDLRGRRGDQYFVIARSIDGTRTTHGPVRAR